jgi:hypothetical protein
MTKSLFLVALFGAFTINASLPQYGTKECAEQDGPCSTGGTPKAPTPSPKNTPATTPRGNK